ncbi:MAG: ParB N-terminal domain-containing protein [Verrucomicrobia bacterium]|nr:ParB N-terminal domain-containing protein [Verrucomicrobiota bacterium]
MNDSFSESGHDPIRHVSILEVRPSPENDQLYKPVRETDPEIVELAESIRNHGVIEPLVITLDQFILSGHRRFVAAKVACLTSIPCRVKEFNRTDDPDQFLVLLREYNRQREKSFDEKMREEIVTINPDRAYQNLVERRKEQADIDVQTITIGTVKHRAKISAAKREFLDAVLVVLEENRKFWPLSDRQVHYRLLNAPPLRHSSKPDSTYRNDGTSYKSLVDLLTRARLVGLIPMAAIQDETRPVVTWKTWQDVRGFIRTELDDLLSGYWRNLMQSQPNHIEILVEKNTVANIVKAVAMEFCIPMTSGRGFCSLPPRHAMAKRFEESGRENLIILIASDFDPDGEEIARSFARSMRDDFGISSIHPIKIALTFEQVQRFNLPPQMLAKESSSNCARFVAEYGENVFELEAISPDALQTLVRAAIDSVISVELFNAETDQEKQDAAEIEALRRTVVKSIQERTAA